MHTVEITAEQPRNVFRSEKSEADLLDAFDEAYRALEKQARRHKRRMEDRTKRSVRDLEPVPPIEAPEDDGDDDEETVMDPEIVRVKSHAVKPMAPEEAALQMEMVGHDFFVFTDAQTENVAVVYRRKSGGYGLIEPELD